ncbi:MAG: hypothetical protein AABZ12_02200 [Planctomycetota bacterium]
MRQASAVGLALFASATAVALAISSPQHRWLGWVGLVPLFYAIRAFGPLMAGVCGGVWGLSLFAVAALVGGSSLHVDATTCALLCAIPAAYSFLGAWLTRRVGFSPYLLGLGWVGVEFALVPLGLHYGLMGGTQTDGLAIRLVGSFTGYVVVAFLVAYVNAALLSVLSEVRVSIARPRPVASNGGPQRLIPLDIPSHLSCLLLPQCPRGPPLLA